jgi:beta-glucosidase
MIAAKKAPISMTQKSLSSYDTQAGKLLAQMTLEEKIGQMIQADSRALADAAEVCRLGLGSVLSGGTAKPENGPGLVPWTDLVDSLQKQALSTRLGIPLLYGIDAVHGHGKVLGATIFPHNIGLGCTRDPALVEQAARVTAREVRATGIQWTFAPCLAVPQDIRWGRTYEGFSEDPHLVARLGAAAIRGYQGSDLSNPLSVMTSAKHFAGDGGTAFASSPEGLDRGDTRIDENELRRIHLVPYGPAIEAGTPAIMSSYSSWNGVRCSGHKHLLTDILKTEMGFEGFIISDCEAIDLMDADFKLAVKNAINAGIDMAMEARHYRRFFTFLKELVDEGAVPIARVNDAVLRILRVKYAMGLFEPGRNLLADRSLHSSFGSPAHRAVARRAVRQSLVLLKNSKNLLPLSKQISHIHLAGKNADDIGNQCGGWTIEWNGRSGPITPDGTTILNAVKNAVSPAARVTFSLDGRGAKGADVGIAVIGERPYAEMNGDRADLSLDEEDIQAIRNLKQAGIPVVVILISGRPMIINEVLNLADAFSAAWLPGTEGQGITDVLFGDYPPTGRLSYTWPRSMDQVPLTECGREKNPLFPCGFGLSYE